MRSYPDDDDEYEQNSLKQLNVESWMLECLKLNPDYTSWGPGEDYMSTQGESWSSAVELEGWGAFGPWPLDDLNECVNFYFELARDSENCAACDSGGYNPGTKVIADTFYDLADSGSRWCDAITQDEADALVVEGRLRRFDSARGEWVETLRTAGEVNAANRRGMPGMGDMMHDAINRGILVETRAKRLGVWVTAPTARAMATCTLSRLVT